MTAEPGTTPLDVRDQYGYTPDILPKMIAATARQRPKDVLFAEELARWFVPGPVLEIGAGCGQLSELFRAQGLDATASDIQPFLVDHIASRGVPARVADALNLEATMDRSYANVISGGVSTLITPDLDVVRRTYESVFAALPPGGRFVFVLPSLWGERWSKPRDHSRIAIESGFRSVTRFRNQLLPTSAYWKLPPGLLRALERSIGRYAGIRTVFVFEAPAAAAGWAPPGS